jgi:hypothetical protein
MYTQFVELRVNGYSSIDVQLDGAMRVPGITGWRLAEQRAF